MALALLELTETVTGDVLEQLLVINVSEASALRQDVPGGGLSRVRLYTAIDSGLPGVPSIIRSHLECAAMTSLTQIARSRSSAMHSVPATFRALWREGDLQELQAQSLPQSLDALQLRSPAGDCVLIEIHTSVPEEVAIMKHRPQPLYCRLRGNVTRHILHCRRYCNSLSLTASNL